VKRQREAAAVETTREKEGTERRRGEGGGRWKERGKGRRGTVRTNDGNAAPERKRGRGKG
jgi:hypothetical protein